VQTLKERLFPFLIKIQSPVEQSSYIESIAKELDIAQTDIARELMLFAASKPQTEQTVVDTIARETVTLPERFLALSIKYPTPTALEARKSLEALSFDGEQFTFPVLDADRMSELEVLVERDYGTLPAAERDMLVAEFAEKLRAMFDLTLRRTLSKKLEQAERDGNEDEIRTLMTTLHTLNQRRHGAP
jgi:hypothetical protein